MPNEFGLKTPTEAKCFEVPTQYVQLGSTKVPYNFTGLDAQGKQIYAHVELTGRNEVWAGNRMFPLLVNWCQYRPDGGTGVYGCERSYGGRVSCGAYEGQPWDYRAIDHAIECVTIQMVTPIGGAL